MEGSERTEARLARVLPSAVGSALLLLGVSATAPGAAIAQQEESGSDRELRRQQHAEFLQATVPCPRLAVWPPLPDSGRTVFDGGVRVTGETEGDPPRFQVERVSPDSRPDPEITIPQYAYFHHPRGGGCEPVIIVQAAWGALGFERVFGSGAGASFEEYFTLLGTRMPW